MEAVERDKDGKVLKGTILNPLGRGKGVPNKTTSELKKVIQAFVENELERAEEVLNELTPKERLFFTIKLLPYVLPKMNEIVSDNEKVVTISFKD